MKKFLCFPALLISACLPLAAGCSSSGGGGGGSLGLSYETEYICRIYDNSYTTEYSVLFRADGTGEYHTTVTTENADIRPQDYTVSFRYLYYPEQDTVFCLYDSVEYGENHDPDSFTDIDSTWQQMFLCTEDVLYLSDGSLYLNEGRFADFPGYMLPPADSSDA